MIWRILERRDARLKLRLRGVVKSVAKIDTAQLQPSERTERLGCLGRCRLGNKSEQCLWLVANGVECIL